MRLALIGFALLAASAVVTAAPQADSAPAWELVRRLGQFPDGIVGSFEGDDEAWRRIEQREERRRVFYERLVQLGPDALPALTSGLSDRDVRIRRGVAIFLLITSDGIIRSFPHMDISGMVPALVKAIDDSDQQTRGWTLAALASIGPAARAALPALQAAFLNDADADIRRSAQWAITRIDPAFAVLPICRPVVPVPGSPTSLICTTK